MIEKIKGKSISKLSKAFYKKLLSRTSCFINEEFEKNKSEKIMDREWDYLIVLDACRYDLLKKVIDREIPYIISGGSATQEWIKWNFNKKYKKTICIAGNPHLSTTHLVKTFGFNPFKRVIDVWDFGWSKKYKTCPPEEVRRAALQLDETYERLIIHFNQPHRPFILDNKALELDDGTWNKLKGGMWDGKKYEIWDAIKDGKITIKRVKKAYKNNLKLALREVNILKKKLDGKIIVTSDHGNLFGEYLLFGHPSKVRVEELIKVPWVKIKDTEKKETKDTKEEKNIKRTVQKLKKNKNI